MDISHVSSLPASDQSLHGLLQVHTEKQRHDLNRTGPLVTDTIQEVRSLVTHYSKVYTNITVR